MSHRYTQSNSIVDVRSVYCLGILGARYFNIIVSNGITGSEKLGLVLIMEPSLVFACAYTVSSAMKWKSHSKHNIGR